MSGISRTIHWLRIVVIIAILGITAFEVITGWTSQITFLSISVIIVLFAFLNFIYIRESGITNWARYAALLFVAMAFGSIGDFALGGIFYLTSESLINGVIFFGVGHVFYILALKDRSPLLFRSSDSSEGQSRLISKNLGIWIACVIGVILVFVFTVYDPGNMVMSIGVFGYGIILVSALAFALTKWFDSYPLYFKLAIALGFFLFLFSDWIIGVRALRDPNFLSSMAIGVTYISGQLLIHLTVMLGPRSS
ncbi:MAG: lysoplasmalogenase family protein [Candidatus Thorarchaeota archaeon]